MLTMSKLKLPKASVTTNGDRNGDRDPWWLRAAPEHEQQQEESAGDHSHEPPMIKRLRISVRKPARDGGGDLGRELDRRATREQYWRDRVAEWAAEVPLSDEVKDDALAQLKLLGWPATADISYELS